MFLVWGCIQLWKNICKDAKPLAEVLKFRFFFAPNSSNPPKHRCENKDLRMEISVRFNSGIFKLQSLCSHGNRYFYPLGSALVRWICWEIFSLLGPIKMLGLGQKKTRNKSPPATKKNMQEFGDNFGDASTQQSMAPCATLQNTPKKPQKLVLEKSHFSFSVSLLDSLLWDELYGLSWNSRN